MCVLLQPGGLEEGGADGPGLGQQGDQYCVISHLHHLCLHTKLISQHENVFPASEAGGTGGTGGRGGQVRISVVLMYLLSRHVYSAR